MKKSDGKNGKTAKTTPKSGGVARIPETPNLHLARILEENGAVEKSVKTLTEMLDATMEFWSKKDECMVLEVDGATRVKAAQILLAYSVGDPVKRQQILSGKLPVEPVDRTALRETIDKKIAAMVNRPDVTLQELLQACKALAESDKDSPMSPMTEAELVKKAREIHGTADPEVGAVQ